jgi:hypothetical protein
LISKAAVPLAMIDSNALPPCDFDHDGTVELDDLMIVIDKWSG